MIRRLNGIWNQTFTVAGSAIRVLFRSNCYTGFDGLVGPASVNVVATSDSPRDFGVPTNYAISSDYQQTLFVPGAQGLAVTTSGKLSPSHVCGAGDAGDYIDIQDQAGTLIRRFKWSSSAPPRRTRDSGFGPATYIGRRLPPP